MALFPGDRQPEFVFNLAGESKYGQDETAYVKGILDLTRLCATAAKAAGVRQFIQVSTAQVASRAVARARDCAAVARARCCPCARLCCDPV